MKRAWLLLLLIACRTEPVTPKLTAPGPEGVGVRTLELTRDGGRLVVELWYPAAAANEDETRDAPMNAGRFPLVVHSHGFQDNRRGEAYLARHLASHGFLVAAPDYPFSNSGAPGGATVAGLPEQPRDLSFVIDALLADPELGQAIDAQHIGASGLSLGGITTLLAAFHSTLNDDRIGAALPIAAPSCMLTPAFFSRAIPLLLLHGDADTIIPIATNAAAAFLAAKKPRTLVTLKNASHTGFVGIAEAFDTRSHYDRIGCSALSGGKLDLSTGLGGEDAGILPASDACVAVCRDEPKDPALAARRQQTLTKAVALAFFSTWAKGRPDAINALAAENEEIDVKSER